MNKRAKHSISGKKVVFILFWATLLRQGVVWALYMFFTGSGAKQPLSVLSQILHTPDAVTYHLRALNLITQGFEPFSLHTWLNNHNFYVFLAWIYDWFGADSLIFAAVNSICFGLVGGLVYLLLTARGKSPYWALALALLAVFWPPSFSYASVPMRDAMVLCGLTMLISGVSLVWRRNSLLKNPRAMGGLAGLAGIILLILSKPYLLVIFIIVTIFSLAVFLLWNWIKNFRQAPVRACLAGMPLLLILMALGVSLSGDHPPRISDEAPTYAQLVQSSLVQPWVLTAFLREGYIRSGGNSLSKRSQEIRLQLGFADINTKVDYKQWKKALQNLGQTQYDRWPIWYMGKWQWCYLYHKLSDLPWMVWSGFIDLWLFPHFDLLKGNLAKTALAVQIILYWLLLPGVAMGIWRGGKDPCLVPIMGWFILGSLLLSLVVVNLGTLFRFRDMFWLPGLLIWEPMAYRLPQFKS